jgi:hypothetical protein
MPETSTANQGRFTGTLQLISWLAGALVVCLYLTYGISRSLWLDEASTFGISQGSPRQVIDSASRDVSPPLYYLVLSVWARSFGNSEIALRIPSLFFYLAGICLMWFLGLKVLGAEGAGLAAFVFAVNPIVGRQAQNIRMYTMLALLVVVSMIVFVILLREKDRRKLRWFALFGLIALLGMNTHYWFAFVLLAYGAWILFTWRSWSIGELALLGSFTVLPFLIIDLPFFLRQSRLPAASWTPSPTLGMLMGSVETNFGLIPRSPRATAVEVVFGLLILCWILAQPRKWQPVQKRSAIFAGFLYAIAIGIPFLISLRRPMFWPGRYDIIAIPFFALLVASLLLRVPVRLRTVFQLILACSCGFYFVRAVHASQATDWLMTLDPVPLGDRAAASAICAESAPGDFVVYTGLSRAAVGFYLQHLGCSENLKEVSYPDEFKEHSGWQDPERDYSSEPAIRREAESVVARARASGMRIFLLFQKDPRLSAGIVTLIERDFHIVSSRRFASCGPCFDELRVYSPSFDKKKDNSSPSGDPMEESARPAQLPISSGGAPKPAPIH